MRFVARVVLIFLLIEGTASVGHVVWLLATRSARPLAERFHTRHDPELGWAHEPSVALPDFYGPGRSLHVNAAGFRDERELPAVLAPDKVRVICSGDSFTLGYGVDDADTWCRQLERLDPRIESVNLGQGGYGLDQAYLWYRRDGAKLRHQHHVFAFISEDFRRMGDSSFLGYGKPRLRVEGARLLVENVPVPEQGYRLPWLTQNAHLFDRLESVAFLRGLVRALLAGFQEPPEMVDTAKVTLKIFDELARLHRAGGRRFLLVYLPVQEDYRSDEHDGWRRFVGREAAQRRIRFLDLVEKLRELPEHEIPALFIAEGVVDFPSAAGHYSAAGNRRIAGWIAPHLDTPRSR